MSQTPSASSDVTKLPTRNELHIIRKLWHMTGGILLVLLWDVADLTHQQMTSILFGLFSAFLVSEVGRRYIAPLNAIIIKVAGSLLRQHEVKQFSGSFFFVLGSLLVTAFTPKIVAILSILFLSIGDPIASFFGILTRNIQAFRIQKVNKSLLGSSCAFLVCFGITYHVLKYHTFPNQSLDTHILLISLAGGLFGSLSELLAPLVGIDDNLVIPVVSSIGLWSVLIYLGAQSLEWVNNSLVAYIVTHEEL